MALDSTTLATELKELLLPALETAMAPPTLPLDTDDANNPITDPNLKDSDNNPIPLSAAGIQMIEDYQLDALATAIATQVSAAVVAHINANAQVELLATVEELKSAVLTLMNTHIANIPVPMDGGSVLTIAMKAALPAHVTALTPKIPTDSIL